MPAARRSILSSMNNRGRRQFAKSLCLTLAVAASCVSIAAAEELMAADRVVVRKAERTLYLYRGGELLGAYRVALGLNPIGHKQRESDFRTPEGRYSLAQRNTRSSYFLSI